MTANGTRRGFSLIELLITSTVACAFMVSVLSMYFSLNPANDGEKSIVRLERELFAQRSVNDLSDACYTSIPEDGKQVNGKSICDLVDAVMCATHNVPEFMEEDMALGNDRRYAAYDTYNLSFFVHWISESQWIKSKKMCDLKIFDGVKGVYLKPLYTEKFRPASPGSLGLEPADVRHGGQKETWADGAPLRLTQRNFKTLLAMKESGEVAKIFMVIDR
jgi:prepilin-type N-terminal cleavage/methylation domain-containing protein